MSKKNLSQLRTERRPYIEGQEYYCVCGCGNKISFAKNHLKFGVANYISGHNPNPPCSEEHKQKLSKLKKGISRTKEFCELMRIRTTESMKDPNRRLQNSLAKKGKPSYIRTKAHNETMSKIKKERNIWVNGTEEQKSAASKLISQNIAKRIIDSGGINIYKHCKKGYYYSEKNQKELYYSSSYELQAFKILEQLSKVKSYGRCDYYIEYKFKDKLKNYIPDILVTYFDDTKEVLEIKPENLLSDEKNQAKFAAGIEFCESNNIKYSIWTEQNLNL